MPTLHYDSWTIKDREKFSDESCFFQLGPSFREKYINFVASCEVKSENSWIFWSQFHFLGVISGSKENCVMHTSIYVCSKFTRATQFNDQPNRIEEKFSSSERYLNLAVEHEIIYKAELQSQVGKWERETIPLSRRREVT